MSSPAKLTDQQINEIVRLRIAGLSYKVIGLQVKCTPSQVQHYWRHSLAYRPNPYRTAAAQKREASNIEKWQAKRRAAIAAAQTRAAARILQLEIADAVAEAPLTPPFKTGDLVWS